jgi:RimJ/RimL family protein N-acetyltransferase
MAIHLATQRLRLRPFTGADAARFAELAGALAVSRMTTDIPHPLSTAQAAAWVRHVPGDVRFAIEHEGAMVGGVGYFLKRGRTAELGFWLGQDHWGHGFATEAAGEVVRHGFADGGVDVFTTSHFADNHASRRVIAKLGFVANGTERMWSPARGVDATAFTYRLERADAVAAGPHARSERPRWRERLARVRSLVLG